MKGVLRGVLWVLIILYLGSPADFCPGAIDDVILLMVFLACQQPGSSIGSYDGPDDEE